MEYILAFVGYALIDIVWAKYTQTIARDQVVAACIWSAIVPVLSAGLVFGYLANPWLLIPMAAGAAAGTWIGMRYMPDVHVDK